MVISNAGKVVAAISAVNECVTFFQWVKSLWSHRNRTENQEEDDVPKLQSSLGAHSSGTEKQELTKEDDVLKLQSSLYTLSGMYSFTDQAQVLPELKAAVCDMQDLLEDFRCYQQQKAKIIEGSATSAEPGTKFFHDFIQGSFSKLIHIQQRLHNQYRLLEGMSLHQATPRFDRSLRHETTSFPTAATIFGRDDEIEELIRMLGVPANNSRGPSRLKRKRGAISLSASNQVCGALDNNEATIKNVPVLPIVGFGGVGKTTLAQLICHHPQVKKHFDVIAWIYVSDYFDVKRLTKEAIEIFSGKPSKEDNLSSLQADLANSINRIRFLVVLDNMWSENGELWKTFYAPFKHALEGSMMLVTTRSPKVADVVHTVDPFLLEGLKDVDLYSFFKLCSFGSDSYKNNPVLERIGMQIVPKLKGSPLAAKVCGRMLRMNLDPAHWHSILKSQLWEPWLQEETDILPALQLKGKMNLERIPQTDVPPMLEPQHFASTSAGTQAATSFHTDVPPMCPHPMSTRQKGQIDNDSSVLKVLKIVLCMNKDMSNALHREKQARKRDSKRIKRDLRQIKKLRTEAGKAVSPSESEAEELEVESEGEQYPDFDALISQVRSEQQYGQSYALADGYGYGFGGQFHPGASSSSALLQHQQYGQSYAPGGGYGFPYGFGGQFHPGASSSSALQQHQQYGQTYAPGGGYGYGFGGQFHPGASSSALQQPPSQCQ